MPRFIVWASLAALLCCAATACGGNSNSPADGGSASDGGASVDDGGSGDGGPTGPLDNRNLFISLNEAIGHTSDVAAQRALLDKFLRDVEQSGGFPVRGGGDVTFLYRGTVQTPPLYLVGSFNGWTVGQKAFFQVHGTDLWAATVSVGGTARHEYRYVDGDRQFADPHNHLVAWDGVDRAGARGAFSSVLMMPEHVATKGVLRYEPGLRDRWIFLPASYLQGDGRPFPALYVHDGNESLTAGHFETVAEGLMEAGALPKLVMVFLDANAERRTFDYTTGPATGGNAYVDALKMTTIPDLERRYRLSNSDRALVGNGLGGLITFHAARRYPGFWTRLGAQSPAFSWDNQRIIADYRDGAAVAGRFYFDSGTPGDVSDVAPTMSAALQAKGYTYQYTEVPAGTPTWPSWQARFADLLRYLYPAP